MDVAFTMRAIAYLSNSSLKQRSGCNGGFMDAAFTFYRMKAIASFSSSSLIAQRKAVVAMVIELTLLDVPQHGFRWNWLGFLIAASLMVDIWIVTGANG